MTTELIHPIKVDDDVWLELIRRKYAGRYHNVNEPLREALGLPTRARLPVKMYSDEGDERSIARSLVPIKTGGDEGQMAGA